MIRTQISMTEDQAEALRRLSNLRKVSQAALLRDALDELLGDDVRQRRIERARAACGAFRADAADAGDPPARRPAGGLDHDVVLDEAFSARPGTTPEPA